MTEAPAFEIKPTTMPARAGGSGRPSKYGGPNPFAEVLATSYEKFADSGELDAHQVVVTGKQVTGALGYLRAAGETLGVGIRIHMSVKNGSVVVATGKQAREDFPDHKVTIRFAAQERRQRKAKPSEDSDSE